MNHRQDEMIYEDEIDLRDIITTLWKRKSLIIVITTICVIAAIVYSLLHPKIYRIFMVIEPCIIDINQDGKYIYMDTSENIKGKIESGAYIPRIANSLNLSNSDKDILLQVTQERNADSLVVSAEYAASKTGLGLKIFDQLLSELQMDYALEIKRKLDDYQMQIHMKENHINEIEIQRKDIDKQIAIKQSFIKEKKEQIKVLNSNLQIYEQREKDLLGDLKGVKENTQRLVKQRDDTIPKGSSTSEAGMSDLLYSTTIQQNISFFNELKKQINDLKIEAENTKSYIKSQEKDIMELSLDSDRLQLQQSEELQSQINATKIEIEWLQNKIELIHNLKTIGEPTISPRPVKPRIILNIAISLIAGLLIGMFMALFTEYLSIQQKPS